MGYPSRYVKRNPCVYLMSVGNYLKIGKSFGDASERAHQFKQSCPFPVVLLGTMDGDKKLERELHKRFSQHRVRANENKGGEWYFYSPEILSAFGVTIEPF